MKVEFTSCNHDPEQSFHKEMIQDLENSNAYLEEDGENIQIITESGVEIFFELESVVKNIMPDIWLHNVDGSKESEMWVIKLRNLADWIEENIME